MTVNVQYTPKDITPKQLQPIYKHSLHSILYRPNVGQFVHLNNNIKTWNRMKINMNT